MKIILKNARLLNPEQKLNETSDLLITNGVITKVGSLNAEDTKNARTFELNNKYVVPGLFDMHVHLREPGREDEETVVTGSNSAAAGGFTGLACMPNTNPAIDSAEIVSFIKEKAKNHLVDVYPVGAVTMERKGESLSPMAELNEAGVVAFSDDGDAIKNARILRLAFEYASMYGIPIMEHCEDESLAGGVMNEGVTSTFLGLPPMPSIAEDLTVMRDIMMAEYTGGKIHITHISTKNSIEMVRQAKKRGVKITSDVTPHHFSLTEEALKNYDTNTKMNPPLRTRADVDAVLEALKDGTIDAIASDHAPHSIEEKEMEFIYAPNGIVGLETELGLALSELLNKKILSIEEIVNKLSVNPRKILNLPVPKIAEGEIANLTIIDPEVVWTVDVKQFKSKSKNSPFDKRLLTGKALGVINKGKMFFEDKFFAI
ncbi:MAG: dihydroorotase [Ignavibacteria bacterium]|jgi:dihydroorotase|nr:dihydroorotase [Ignavibacteria bacterium]MCU7498051.1 dihydroorotase [Ignavibacteria bacterium]MCU7512125.1 dihydroorotase [Ignavibacteria bacterium]MCU7520430.1 dihydroorotase [Ignavibacteria bacterium]MCU7523889.1 dihydroorotase [Ignavibacteria bacterium]